MPKTSALTDLRKMTPEDLRKDIESSRREIAAKRLQIAQRSEKDTARYRRQKRDLARMMTVLNELNSQAQTATLPPSTRASKASGR